MINEQRNFITVVSGLPRSGTSMMMRMLEQGGIPPLTDGFRSADEDNPLGYFEFEAVKRLGKDASWISDAYGKVVKVIYVFLYSLPQDHQYKVIFMDRSLDEIVASQKTMLRRRNEGDRMTDEQLLTTYQDQLQQLDAWLRKQLHLSVLRMNYDEVVADPTRAALDVKNFLGLDLDIDAMAKSVDSSLYRNRSASL